MDTEFNGPIKPGDVKVMRWVGGLLCGAFLLFVLRELASGTVHWASTDGYSRPRARTGSYDAADPAGLLFFFFAFGAPSLLALLCALAPKAFVRQGLIYFVLALCALGFIGLHFRQH